MPRLLLVVVAIAVASCGGKSSPPPAPTQNAWALSGTVSTTTGTPIVGATAKILDGANANQTAVTNSAGRYTFPSILQANLTFQVSADNYTAESKLIALTRDTTVDFALARILRADLVQEGNVVSTPKAPDFQMWDFAGHGRNRGDGCAGSIAGTTALINGLDVEVVRRGWTAPAGLIVKPNDRFDFAGCCFSTAELDQTTSHRTTFTFQTVTCQ